MVKEAHTEILTNDIMTDYFSEKDVLIYDPIIKIGPG